MLEKHIGKALAEVRNAKGLTQRELGESVEMHLSTVSAFENGRKSLDLPVLEKFCEALEVRVTDITDVGYINFRQELESRQPQGRKGDEVRVTLASLQEQARHLMKGRDDFIFDLFQLFEYFLREGGMWRLLQTAPPQEPPPGPARRRGRPPGPKKKGSPGKKR